MPEGDTIFRHAAQLSPILVGKSVGRLYLRGLERKDLVGRAITAVEARGKHLLVTITPGPVLHVHLGIHGAIRVRPIGGPVPLSAAAVLETDAHTVLVLHAPTVELLRAAFAKAHPALRALGPDLLGDAVDYAEIARRALGSRATTIAEVLRDQRVAAGLGNVYKSELCFLEGVHPHDPPRTLDAAGWERVFRHGAELLRQNLGPGRRTTTADVSRGMRPTRGKGRVWVYARGGRPCYRCGTTIASLREGELSRSTYYCPSCQPHTVSARPDSPPT